MKEKPLSENIAFYEAGKYIVSAGIWRTAFDHHLTDTFEIGIRTKIDGAFILLQSSKYNHQTVQEVATAIAMLLADSTQCYSPEWCRKFFT